MKKRIIGLGLLAALIFGAAVYAQRVVVSVNTVSDLLLRKAVSGETVMVLNQDGDEYGPSTWYKHIPAGGYAPGPGVYDALPTGQWVLVTSPEGSGSGGAVMVTGQLLCTDDLTVHQLGVVKLGTNYLLGITFVTGVDTNSTPVSFTLLAADASSHALAVRKIGTNYLLELSQ
jgi:hypothetical protein